MPESAIAALDAASGAGGHSGNSGLLPATLMVLAMLVVGGVVLDRRRTPASRVDLRPSTPG